MAVLHRAHTSGFCSALEQLPHSVGLLLSLSSGMCLHTVFSAIFFLQNPLQRIWKYLHTQGGDSLAARKHERL